MIELLVLCPQFSERKALWVEIGNWMEEQSCADPADLPPVLRSAWHELGNCMAQAGTFYGPS